MSSKREQNNDREFKSVSYSRLLRYAKPYWKRLAVGIFFGLVIGGSLFSTFLIIPKMLMIVDHEEADRTKMERTAGQILQKMEESKSLSDAEKKRMVTEILKPSDDDPKLTESMDSLRRFAERFHLPMTVGKREISVHWPTEFSFRITQPETGKIAWQFFAIYALGFVLLWTLKALSTYINHYFTRWVGCRVIMDMRNDIYSSLIRQSLSFYGRQDIGHLISRCTNDTQAIEQSVSNAIAELTQCPIEVIACAVAII